MRRCSRGRVAGSVVVIAEYPDDFIAVLNPLRGHAVQVAK
jgi:hypothetical protein